MPVTREPMYCLVYSLKKTPKGQDGVFSSAVWDENDQSYVVKVINTSAEDKPVRLVMDGAKRLGKVGTLTLDCSHYEGENTVDNPNSIVPVENYAEAQGNTVETIVGAKSFVVYRIAKEGRK